MVFSFSSSVRFDGRSSRFNWRARAAPPGRLGTSADPLPDLLTFLRNQHARSAAAWATGRAGVLPGVFRAASDLHSQIAMGARAVAVRNPQVIGIHPSSACQNASIPREPVDRHHASVPSARGPARGCPPARRGPHRVLGAVVPRRPHCGRLGGRAPGHRALAPRGGPRAAGPFAPARRGGRGHRGHPRPRAHLCPARRSDRGCCRGGRRSPARRDASGRRRPDVRARSGAYDRPWPLAAGPRRPRGATFSAAARPGSRRAAGFLASRLPAGAGRAALAGRAARHPSRTERRPDRPATAAGATTRASHHPPPSRSSSSPSGGRTPSGAPCGSWCCPPGPLACWPSRP